MSRLRPTLVMLALGLGVALGDAAVAQQQRSQRPGPAASTLAGNAERGAEVYENRCTGCHSLDANRIGPAHRGVVGRRAGTASGFEYSDALRASRLVWSEALIQRWLANPEAVIPGQQMGFRLGDAQERADVAAFLARESQRRPAP